MSNEGAEFENGSAAQVDLSGVEEDAGFELLPKGTYDVIVENAEAKTSSSGNPMFSLTLVVTSGDFENRKLFTHVVFAPKTMGQAKRTINRLGLAELLEGPFAVDQDTADKFVGIYARAVVGIQKYEGEDRNNVKNLLPAMGESDGFLNSED